jgi:uncharacterized protein (DUF2147 family)
MSIAHARAAVILALSLALTTLSPPVRAADLSSPVGEWRTIDDATGAPRALVRIVERDGALVGVVEKPLMAHPAQTRCDACTDDRRGQPIVGMEIIRGLRRDGDGWGGGTILDPENGKIYRCTLALRDGGTRVWQRAD